MTRKLGGLAGVLGHLTSGDGGEPAPSREKPKINPPTETPETPAAASTASSTTTPPTTFAPARSGYARRGRLPGPRRHEQEPKAKVSLSVPVSLLEDYRAWSWQLRCQLGDLFARALAEYQENHRKGRKTT